MDRHLEQPAGFGEFLLEGRLRLRVLAREILRFEARGVDRRVRFDRGVEIAIGGFGALGLAREIRAKRFHGGLHVGEVGADHFRLRLRLGQHVRHLVVLLALAVEGALGRVERGERVALRLLRFTARGGDRTVERFILGARLLELARELAVIRRRLIERAPGVGEILLGVLPRLGLLTKGGFRLDARRVDLRVRLDCRVEIAIGGVRTLGLALDFCALVLQFLVQPVDDCLGFFLNLLRRDAHGRAGRGVEAANQLLELLIGLGGGVLRLDVLDHRVEGFAKRAEVLEGHLGLAGEQPGEQP
jgi:hypothetical protein